MFSVSECTLGSKYFAFLAKVNSDNEPSYLIGWPRMKSIMKAFLAHYYSYWYISI